MTTSRPRRRFTGDEYDRMLEAGILARGEPVELLAGEIYEGSSMDRRRFTTDEYQRMLEVGVLYDGEPVELLAGEILEAASVSSRHIACVNRLTRLFTRHLGDRAIVSVQNPVTLDDASEPEPDLAVVAWRDDFYVEAVPRPEDVLLVIEVAETTYADDRDRKLPLYAGAGIVELWIVRLDDATIEQHLDPSGARYRTLAVRGRGETIAPRMLPDLQLEVDEIVP